MPKLPGIVKYLSFAKPRQTSFRGILLWRILLLSIPILLLGQYVTYRKARSSLLETARQNLTESAVREAESLETRLKAWQAHLLSATQTSLLRSGPLEESENYLHQLARQLPMQVNCIRLQDVKTDKIVARTCENRAMLRRGSGAIAVPLNESMPENNRVSLEVVFPEALAANANWQNQLHLIWSGPVYNSAGQQRAFLMAESVLILPQIERPKSLAGYAVVIDGDGKILAHPDWQRVGRNIADENNRATRTRLQSLVKNAIAGRQDFLHLAAFDESGLELLAGYTAIPNPTTIDTADDQWAILAVTSLDNALFGLEEILQSLIHLILLLIAANLVATLFLAQDLARPMEKLGQYARNVECRSATEPVPHNFKIREFNQLAQALNSTIERLKAWTEELESAWKEAKAADKLKSEFLANISHELRTPLNAIIGSIRLVLDDCCDDRDEEREFLQQADNAAVHLLDIINNILDLAKVEAGTLSVELERVELQQVLKEAIDLQIVNIHQKGLQLTRSEPLEPIAVRADPAKLKQVFLNILSNAIKFTDTGSITISILEGAVASTRDKLSATDTSQMHVKILVQDTGVGIDKASQPKLFQPFVMADGTRTRRFEGTGLGLAISRNLIELMDGSIALYSEGKNRGTTVEILLPLMRTSPALENAELRT